MAAAIADDYDYANFGGKIRMLILSLAAANTTIAIATPTGVAIAATATAAAAARARAFLASSTERHVRRWHVADRIAERRPSENARRATQDAGITQVASVSTV